MGIVGIGLKSGGFEALADVLVKFIKDSYTGQLVTYLFGFLIFFDDYSNTMIVGNIIVPVTDKMRVSREKLSFIVDCTAAPIAGLHGGAHRLALHDLHLGRVRAVAHR
jgi:Na+/H+ antiporter NhaC